MRYIAVVLVSISFTSFAQKPVLPVGKQDSIQQVVYQQALDNLKNGKYAEASVQFSQLITTGFSNKEVYVKRGIAYFYQNDFEKAKADLDEEIGRAHV